MDGDAGWILGKHGWWRSSVYTSKEQILDFSEMLKKDCSPDAHVLVTARAEQDIEGEEILSPCCDPPAGLFCASQVLVFYAIHVAFNQKMCSCI